MTKLIEMCAIHTNHYQSYRSNSQIKSCSMFMEQGDYYDLIEKYQGDQNTRVGDESLLEGVPALIKTQLNLFGGSVEWSEESDTETWVTVVTHVVFDHNGETVWENIFHIG